MPPLFGAGKALVPADGQHLLADREVSLPPNTPLSLVCVLGGSALLPYPVVNTPFFSTLLVTFAIERSLIPTFEAKN